jgi:hypothetical protein
MNLGGRLNLKTQERFVLGEERDVLLMICDGDTCLPFDFQRWVQTVRFKNLDGTFVIKTPEPVAYILGQSKFRLSADEIAALPRKKNLHLEVKFVNIDTQEVKILLLKDCMYVEESAL